MTYTIYRPNSSGEIMAAFRPQKRFAELVRDDKLPAERDCSVYLKGVIERMTGDEDRHLCHRIYSLLLHNKVGQLQRGDIILLREDDGRVSGLYYRELDSWRRMKYEKFVSEEHNDEK